MNASGSPGRGALGAIAARACGAVALAPELVRATPLVAQPIRLARGELAGLPVALPYRLRGSDLSVYIRHTRGDLRRLAGARRTARAIPPPAARILAAGPLRLLDLAPGLGYFGLWLLDGDPRAELVSFEPDPLAAVLLRRSVRVNRLEGRWRVVPAAPSVADAVVSVTIDGLGSEEGRSDRPARAVAGAVDVLAQMAGTSLLRISSAGEHRRIVADERFAAAGVGVVMVDAAPAPALIPTELLSRAGYATAVGRTSTWAWRAAQPPQRDRGTRGSAARPT